MRRGEKRSKDEGPRARAHGGLAIGRAPADLTEALRAAGLRRTSPRVAVLERLDAATSPLSHAELAEELSSFGYDRVTVYRNLSDLVGVGLVTRRDVGDHVWRFELVRARGRPHGGEHPHFLCIDCGDVSCLPDNAVKITASRNVPRSVSRRAVEVQVKGRCDACAR